MTSTSAHQRFRWDDPLALVQHEAADLTLVVLGPDHEHVGDRRSWPTC
ncbi:MAG TPA: hypothetical protein VF319_11980 [Caldimonas sp.]